MKAPEGAELALDVLDPLAAEDQVEGRVREGKVAVEVELNELAARLPVESGSIEIGRHDPVVVCPHCASDLPAARRCVEHEPVCEESTSSRHVVLVCGLHALGCGSAVAQLSVVSKVHSLKSLRRKTRSSS